MSPGKTGLQEPAIGIAEIGDGVQRDVGHGLAEDDVEHQQVVERRLVVADAPWRRRPRTARRNGCRKARYRARRRRWSAVRGVACWITCPRLKSSKKLPALVFAAHVASQWVRRRDGKAAIVARHADMLIVGDRLRRGDQIKRRLTGAARPWSPPATPGRYLVPDRRDPRPDPNNSSNRRNRLPSGTRRSVAAFAGGDDEIGVGRHRGDAFGILDGAALGQAGSLPEGRGIPRRRALFGAMTMSGMEAPHVDEPVCVGRKRRLVKRAPAGAELHLRIIVGQSALGGGIVKAGCGSE